MPSIPPKDFHNSIDNSANDIEYSTNYEVFTYSGQTRNIGVVENKHIQLERPKISGYLDKLSNKTDVHHSFPYSFDKQIVEQGMLFGTSGNSSMYYAPGYINGVKGFYTIGVNNQNGIIYHRQFIKLINWNNFHFP